MVESNFLNIYAYLFSLNRNAQLTIFVLKIAACCYICSWYFRYYPVSICILTGTRFALSHDAKVISPCVDKAPVDKLQERWSPIRLYIAKLIFKLQ